MLGVAAGMIASGVMGAAGSKKAARAEAKAAKFNAKLNRRQAVEAKAISDYRVRMIHEAGAEMQGQVEAETGKSGLAMTGTPLATLVDNARKIELSAAMEVRSGNTTYENYMLAAEAGVASANAISEAGNWNAASSIVGGVGGALNSYYQPKAIGAK